MRWRDERWRATEEAGKETQMNEQGHGVRNIAG